MTKLIKTEMLEIKISLPSSSLQMKLQTPKPAA